MQADGHLNGFVLKSLKEAVFVVVVIAIVIVFFSFPFLFPFSTHFETLNSSCRKTLLVTYEPPIWLHQSVASFLHLYQTVGSEFVTQLQLKTSSFFTLNHHLNSLLNTILDILGSIR